MCINDSKVWIWKYVMFEVLYSILKCFDTGPCDMIVSLGVGFQRGECRLKEDVCVWERDSGCVCVREKERESECVCMRLCAYRCVCKSVYMHVWLYVCRGVCVCKWYWIINIELRLYFYIKNYVFYSIFEKYYNKLL